MQTLFYLFNTDYPNTKAHSIQITKTLFSLKPYFQIICVVNSLTVPRTELFATVQKRFGYDLQGIEFLAIPKKHLQGLRFHLTLKKILSRAKQDACFYTRSYNLAKRLVRSRIWHKKKVILEAHKKDGYYKEEQVPDSQYRMLRTALENDNHSIEFLRNLYKSVDGIVFTSAASEQIVRSDLQVRNTTHIWYPLNKKYSDIPHLRPRHFVYCGSIGHNKLTNLLVDALVLAPKNIIIDIYGGKDIEIKELQEQAQKKNVLDRIQFKGKISYQQLASALQNYQFGIATMEGIKVVDYLENGLTPIIPSLSTYSMVFEADQVIYFSPDSPMSLSNALATAQNKRKALKSVDNIIERYSILSFGDHLACFIREFSHA